MSTDYYPFTGLEQSSVTFSPVLDGIVYTCQIMWNIAAQRWYLLITNSAGNPVLNTAMVGSTSTGGINLIAGVFTATTLIWREKNGQIEVTS
ncbi:phage baseplate plug family protein [Dickeya fangzhongdai]|uniref:phage baseplate plug family protein n=1 Tax=Dickeya fangzhongdai TaxID=1778540 RepID=UPI0023E399B5|nr:hypothetical protein [Dickeya fangzhongdai]WES88773.1 hypothetical protein PQ617_21635 [Dickeya fangzhongdai]